jgi:membrane protein YdbS with pleckstrin-like domain
MVMTPCAILAWGMSFYFNNKDMALIKNNVPKKYVTLFYISNIVFFVFIFACTVLFTVLVIILFQQRALIDETTAFAITFAVSAVFSIIAISLNRYALYAMEFEIYKKRYGEIAKDKKNETK